MVKTYYPHRKVKLNAFPDFVQWPATLVDTDSTGDIDVQFCNLRNIIDENSVYASIEGGYKARAVSISGSTATIRIYRGSGATAGGVDVAHASQTDLGVLHAQAMGY
jgi:hypothetical protein